MARRGTIAARRTAKAEARRVRVRAELLESTTARLIATAAAEGVTLPGDVARARAERALAPYVGEGS